MNDFFNTIGPAWTAWAFGMFGLIAGYFAGALMTFIQMRANYDGWKPPT